MNDDVLLEIDFVDASEWTQEIAQPSPEALGCIDVDFAFAVPVQVFGPDSRAGRMADAHALAPGFLPAIVPAPFVSIDGGPWNGEGFDLRLQVGNAVGFTDLQARLPTLPAKGADH